MSQFLFLYGFSHVRSIQVKAQSLIRPMEGQCSHLASYFHMICSNRHGLYRIMAGMWSGLSFGYATDLSMLSAPEHKPGQTSSSSSPSAPLSSPLLPHDSLQRTFSSNFPCIYCFLPAIPTCALPIAQLFLNTLTAKLTNKSVHSSLRTETQHSQMAAHTAMEQQTSKQGAAPHLRAR